MAFSFYFLHIRSVTRGRYLCATCRNIYKQDKSATKVVFRRRSRDQDKTEATTCLILLLKSCFGIGETFFVFKNNNKAIKDDFHPSQILDTVCYWQ